METPDYLEKFRAKNPSQGGESLYEHTWHVVARFADQARLRSSIATQIGNERLWHQLYWSCFLHDFGKATGGFQRMLKTDGKERWKYRHEVGSLAFLGWLFPDTRSEDYRWIVAAIVSHHKDARVINETYKLGGPSIQEIAAELAIVPLNDLWRWVNDYASVWQQQLKLEGLGINLPTLLPQEEAVALVQNRGVEQIEQALKVYRQCICDLSLPTFRKQYTNTLALRGMIIMADHSASAHVGPPPTLPEVDYTTIVEQLGWGLDGLYDHQSTSATTKGDALLIAPTGSGKTESALFWAFGTKPQQLPRLFYALPFQASMNTMRLRLEQIFPAQVGLQHSRAVQAIYRVYIEDGDDPRFAMQRAKQQKNCTELNYFPVRVFSPYQMLKACYRLRGYESIMSDFFGAAFIFDEIHAYEPKRLALILALVGHLKKHYGARFFVMSATFPDLIKIALREQLGAYTEITTTSALFQEFQRHQLHLLAGDLQESHHIAHIAAEAKRGQSVLVCCNTVTRAQKTWQLLRSALGKEATIVLLHSRLNGRDRLERENIVRLACGVGSAERHPVVLVATQVVEVSLNIDLDTIYTDLAPLEALIQRFGRINRSRRRDADGKTIVVPVRVFREPIAEKDDRPYKLSLLHGTLRLLEEQDGNIINEEAVSSWLNTIYNDYAEGYATTWQEEYTQATTDFEEGVLRSLVAFDVSQELQQQFYATFESIDVLPQRFEQEYFTLMSNGYFVEADSLIVSIPYWRYGMLARVGKVRQGDRKADDPLERVTVVMTPYDDDMGLAFDELA